MAEATPLDYALPLGDFGVDLLLPTTEQRALMLRLREDVTGLFVHYTKGEEGLEVSFFAGMGDTWEGDVSNALGTIIERVVFRPDMRR